MEDKDLGPRLQTIFDNARKRASKVKDRAGVVNIAEDVVQQILNDLEGREYQDRLELLVLVLRKVVSSWLFLNREKNTDFRRN